MKDGEKTSQSLEERLAFLEAENLRLQKENQIQKQDYESQILDYQAQLAELKRRLFGQKRERFINEDQLSLPFSLTQQQKEVVEQQVKEEVEKVEKKPIPRPNHKGRLKLPSDLPVEEHILEPEEDTTDCIQVGEEVTEVLDYQPGKFLIKRYIRPKYVKKQKDHQSTFIIAEPKERLFPKCMASEELLAHILVEKYKDHLPLYRQKQRYAREGLKIPDSTLEGWVRQGLDRLEPLYKLMEPLVKSAGYLQVDETPIQVMIEGKKGKTHKGYYWVYNSPLNNACFFKYDSSRGNQSPLLLLSDFKGYLQSDGYRVYDSITDKINKQTGETSIIQLYCWAHARRNFEKALKGNKELASQALIFIQKLYEIEKIARDNKFTPEQRKQIRLQGPVFNPDNPDVESEEQGSLYILNQFGHWLFEQAPNHLPKSLLGKAIEYTISRIDELRNYLYDGRLEIDNNLVENSIRPVALGRKNYLFAGSEKAAQRAAMIYSFFATCHKNDVNPKEWLVYVFNNMLDTSIQDLHSLLPQNFKT